MPSWQQLLTQVAALVRGGLSHITAEMTQQQRQQAGLAVAGGAEVSPPGAAGGGATSSPTAHPHPRTVLLILRTLVRIHRDCGMVDWVPWGAEAATGTGGGAGTEEGAGAQLALLLAGSAEQLQDFNDEQQWLATGREGGGGHRGGGGRGSAAEPSSSSAAAAVVMDGEAARSASSLVAIGAAAALNNPRGVDAATSPPSSSSPVGHDGSGSTVGGGTAALLARTGAAGAGSSFTRVSSALTGSSSVDSDESLGFGSEFGVGGSTINLGAGAGAGAGLLPQTGVPPLQAAANLGPTLGGDQKQQELRLAGAEAQGSGYAGMSEEAAADGILEARSLSSATRQQQLQFQKTSSGSVGVVPAPGNGDNSAHAAAAATEVQSSSLPLPRRGGGGGDRPSARYSLAVLSNAESRDEPLCGVLGRLEAEAAAGAMAVLGQYAAAAGRRYTSGEGEAVEASGNRNSRAAPG